MSVDLVWYRGGKKKQFAQKIHNNNRYIEAVRFAVYYYDITALANFGTRHTLSDTLSESRGIGAARRWIFDRFQKIASNCNGCIEVSYQKNYVKTNGQRIVKDVWINNVIAIQKGSRYPNRFIIMSGDIDSRISDPNN